uniref:Uncharacterized protein n=1 Tax=Anopheles funestus TaxID=62324 RepID=A0A182S0R2_ANOFN
MTRWRRIGCEGNRATVTQTTVPPVSFRALHFSHSHALHGLSSEKRLHTVQLREGCLLTRPGLTTLLSIDGSIFLISDRFNTTMTHQCCTTNTQLTFLSSSLSNHLYSRCALTIAYTSRITLTPYCFGLVPV